MFPDYTSAHVIRFFSIYLFNIFLQLHAVFLDLTTIWSGFIDFSHLSEQR